MIATGGMSTTTTIATETIITDGDTGGSNKQSQSENFSAAAALAAVGGGGSSSGITKDITGGTTNIGPAVVAVDTNNDSMIKADAAVLAAASSASLATAAAAAACVNHSVVPDLMRVYESMTQTSNSSPSKNHNTNTTTSDLNALSQQASYAEYLSQPQNQSTTTMHSQQHHQYYDPNDPSSANNSMYYSTGTGAVAQNMWGNYDTTSNLSVTIPPPYAFPSQQPPPPPQPVYTAGTNLTGENVNNNNTSNNNDLMAMVTTTNQIVASDSRGRPVRTKRNVAAIDPDTGGYDSSVDGNSSGRGGGGGGAPSNPKARRKSNKGGRNNTNTARSSTIPTTTAAAASAGGTNSTTEDKNNNDGRWSKRFTWPDDLHRDFVSAIFDVGLKHSSPSTVMEHMPPHEQITTERIKSHLQKYRLHRQKAKKEFMTSYQQTMEQIHTDGGVGNMTSLAGGQVAAHLSYVSEHHPDPEADNIDEADGSGGGGGGGDVQVGTNNNTSRNEESKFQVDDTIIAATTQNTPLPQTPVVLEDPTQDVFFLPKLTEAEKVSPIGISLGYLMGLFFTLRQQLDIQRQEQEAQLQAQQQQQQQHEGHHDPSRQQLFDEFATEHAGRKMAVASSLHMNPTTVQSSSRNNLEVNSLIKREMQSQMAFQNKMRALKQQELNKYSKTDHSNSNASGSDMVHDHGSIGNDNRPAISMNSISDPSSSTQLPPSSRRGGINNTNNKKQEYQGAGEAGGADASAAVGNREHGVSLGEEDDFWNASVVDDELFDFLMNS